MRTNRHVVLVLRLLTAVSMAVSFSCDEPETMTGTGGGDGGGGGTGGGTATGGGAGGGGGSGACQGSILVITSDTTWSGPLTVDCRVIVSSSATLTVAAGTALRLGGAIDVAGGLRVEGTAASPVTVTRAGATPWGPITLQLRSGGGPRVLSLKHVTFTGGGEATAVETSTSMGAALVQQATDTPVLVDNVTFDGSSGVGVVVEQGGFAAASTALTVKNSGSYPMFVSAERLGSIPPGTYAPNGKTGILTGTAWRAPFAYSTRITTDTTLKKLDVPYVVGTGAYNATIVISTVQSGPPTFAAIPLVTIEAGVEVKFAKVRGVNATQSSLNIDSAPDNGTWKPLGALRAVGTAANPITFTSAEATPAAGDWATIALEELDARTQLDRVVIAYAGANAAAIGACNSGSPSGGGASPLDGDAALQQFMNTGAPSRSSLTNSVIRDSAGAGVYRAFAETDVDFTATNTFTNVAWCRQTSIRIGNACVPMMCN